MDAIFLCVSIMKSWQAIHKLTDLRSVLRTATGWQTP